MGIQQHYILQEYKVKLHKKNGLIINILKRKIIHFKKRYNITLYMISYLNMEKVKMNKVNGIMI